MAVKKAAKGKAAPEKATAKKAGAKKATAKTAAVKASPAKTAASKATPGKAAKPEAVKKPGAQKASAAKKAPAEKATPAKASTAKKGAAKKAEPAKPATSKAAPAKGTDKAAAAKAAAPAKPAAPPKAPAPAPAKAAKPEAPRPTSAGFDKAFLDEQRGELEALRAEYITQAEEYEAEADLLAQELETGDVGFDEEAGEGGAATVDRERNLVLAAQARQAAADIETAMRRIEAGTYGLCMRCGQKLPKMRLKAIPHADLCVDCKAGGLLRRR